MTKQRLYFLASIEIFMLQATMQQVVNLDGEKIVKRFEKIHINCSSNTTPIINAADIYLGEAYYNIRYYDGMCFSTAMTNSNPPDLCQCSTKGLWYSHSFNITQPDGFTYVKCSMLFSLQEIYSDTIKIRIVEFSNPTIYTDADFPLHSGKLVKFSCKLETANHEVNFKWQCLNQDIIDSQVEETTNHSSTITRRLYFKHDTETCICIANVDGYVATTKIRIHVNKQPVIHIDESIFCNTSFFINISCTISSVSSMYGFDRWDHSFHGVFIRSLEGKVQDRQSTLTLPSCSFQDAGDYRCSAWNTFNGQNFIAKKITRLYVNGPPMVTSATQFHEQNVTLSVQFYSPSDATAIWSQLGTSIRNSTKMTPSIRRILVPIQIFNATLKCEGYMANLTVHSEIISTLVVCVKNDFGETRQTFRVDSLQSKGFTVSFDFRSVVIGITAIGMFIVTASVTATVMKGRRISSVVHVIGPHEMSTFPVYHSAPSAEPVIHIYDLANSEYLEVIDNISQQSLKEGGDDSSNTTDTAHDYEEID